MQPNIPAPIAAALAAVALALAILAMWAALAVATSPYANAGPQRTPCHSHGAHTHCHR